MENSVESFSEDESQDQEDEQGQREMPWEEIFDGVPTAPGTEAAQERHKQLREQDAMTEEEEVELNELFFVIYPQFIPDTWKKCQSGENTLRHIPLCSEETTDRQDEIILVVLLLEVCWCWITLLHCGLTFHGFLGCLIVVWWCLIVTHLVNSKDLERLF
jgi:hypothetical protein